MTPRPIKIMHLITGLSTGGSERALARLCERMERERFRNIVVSVTSVGPLGARLRTNGIDVHVLGMNPRFVNPFGLARLLRHMRREQPHILQTWLYHSDFLGLLAARLGGVSRLAWNIRCTEMDGRYSRGIRGALVKSLAHLSAKPDVVVVNSESGRLYHEKIGYRPKHWAHIPNGIDVEHFRPDAEAHASVREELELDPQAPVIGLVARFDPIKDHRTFLLAAGELVKRRSGVQFVLAGTNVDSKNQGLTRLVHSLDLDGCVHLLGERKDIARLTAAFDIATCSSRSEAFPNVICEAMACGVPTVASDVGDIRAVLGEAGITVPRSDPRQLCDAWHHLLAAGDVRQKLGKAARARAIAHYDIRKVASRYEDMYEAMLQPGDRLGELLRP